MEPTDPQTPPPTPPSQPLYPPQSPQNPQNPPQQPPPPQNPGLAARWNAFPTRTKAIIAGVSALIAVCLVCAICNGIINGGKGTTTAQQQNTTAANKTAAPKGPTATATPSFAHFGDGTFKVGKDVQPGTYRTREASSGCYWQRLKGFSGSFDDIIANGNENGPAVVTISANDAGFSSQNCGTWTANLSQITKSKTSFDEGNYIVGTDMDPGTYKSDGGDNCYWQRERDFSGGFSAIIANDNPKGAALVTIKASDKGFASNGCGTWTKQ